jgi:F-type H+-transporting ATPase subunit beta
VSLKDTISGFKDIIDGNLDHIPEKYFYMVGTVDEVIKAYEAENA